MLNVVDLSIGYKNHIPILSNINLSLKGGELVCLIGPNGTGKSTFLRTLGYIQKPVCGKILIDEKELSKMSRNELASKVSFVLTDNVMVNNLKVKDLVLSGRYPYTSWLGNKTKDDLKIACEAMNKTNLLSKRDCLIGELSDGERQRTMIAKALCQNTSLMLLDEPISHLDLINRVETIILLQRLTKDTGKTIIFSCHELDLALQSADVIWLMNENGVKCGSPNELSRNGSIEQCFGNDNLIFDSISGTFKIRRLK